MSTVPLNERLLRAGEVAELIGCSRAMAYRLMQRGTIPIVRIPNGKTIRSPRDSLLNWIKNNTRGGSEQAVAGTNRVPAPKPTPRKRPQPNGRARRAERPR